MIVTVALSVRRLRTVMWLGVGATLGLIVARRVTFRVQEDIVSIERGETNRGAVRDVVGRVFGDLRSFTVWLLVLGIVVAIVAYLAGRPPWFGRLMDRAGRGEWRVAVSGPTTRWLAAHADALKIVDVALAVLLLLVVDVTWWWLLLIVAVGVVVVVLLDQLKTSAGTGAPAPAAGPPA